MQDQRFQRFAARFPLTRPVVKKKANALFDLTAGFVYSQILQACVQLDLLSDLARRAETVDTLAARYGVPVERLRVLLEGAAALDLVKARGPDHYALSDLGACVLGTPGLPEMIRHHALLYRDLSDPLALLAERNKQTELEAYWAYARPNANGADKAGLGSQDVGDYSDLMAASQGFISGDVLDAFDMSSIERLADIGGGQGAFMAAALSRHSKLQGVVFDLPAVAERASDRLVADGFGERAHSVGGDFLAGQLPCAPVMSLIRVLYDHQDANALRILRNVFEALPPRGRLLIAEPMAGIKGAEAMGAAYFGFYLLAMGGGRSRRFDELATLAQVAGFTRITAHRSDRPMLVSVMSAEKSL